MQKQTLNKGDLLLIFNGHFINKSDVKLKNQTNLEPLN